MRAAAGSSNPASIAGMRCLPTPHSMYFVIVLRRIGTTSYQSGKFTTLYVFDGLGAVLKCFYSSDLSLFGQAHHCLWSLVGARGGGLLARYGSCGQELRGVGSDSWAKHSKTRPNEKPPFVVCACLLLSWRGLGSRSVAFTLDRWPHDWFRLAVTGCAGSDARANR